MVGMVDKVVKVRPKKTALHVLGEMCAAVAARVQAGDYLVEVKRGRWELPVHLSRSAMLAGLFCLDGAIMSRTVDQLLEGGLVEEVQVRLFGMTVRAVRLTEAGREVAHLNRDGWGHRECTQKIVDVGDVILDGTFEVVSGGRCVPVLPDEPPKVVVKCVGCSRVARVDAKASHSEIRRTSSFDSIVMNDTTFRWVCQECSGKILEHVRAIKDVLNVEGVYWNSLLHLGRKS